jgi:hypothetical protein
LTVGERPRGHWETVVTHLLSLSLAILVLALYPL